MNRSLKIAGLSVFSLILSAMPLSLEHHVINISIHLPPSITAALTALPQNVDFNVAFNDPVMHGTFGSACAGDSTCQSSSK